VKRALYRIENAVFALGNAHPVRRRAALGTIRGLFRGKPQAGARIQVALPHMRRRCRMQVGARAEAGIHDALGLQRAKRFVVGARAVMLPHHIRVIPGKTKGLQIVHYRVGICALAARRVEVLDAQKNPAAARTGGEPGYQAREYVAHMQPRARRGSHAPDVRTRRSAARFVLHGLRRLADRIEAQVERADVGLDGLRRHLRGNDLFPALVGERK